MKWEAIPGPGLLILHACWDGSVLPGRSGALLQVWICKSWHFPGHRQQQSLGWLEPQAVHHFAWPQLKASEAQSGRGPRMSHVASSSQCFSCCRAVLIQTQGLFSSSCCPSSSAPETGRGHSKDRWTMWTRGMFHTMWQYAERHKAET